MVWPFVWLVWSGLRLGSLRIWLRARANIGSVKFDTKAKDAAVYVDGGYAGTVGQLKTFHLKPGSHQLELRAPDGHSFYQEQVTVIAGKTLTLHP